MPQLIEMPLNHPRGKLFQFVPSWNFAIIILTEKGRKILISQKMANSKRPLKYLKVCF